MRTTLLGRWLEKNNKPFVALLAAGATLAMATLIDASSSSQVEQLGRLAVPRTGHAATPLADGRILITGGRDNAGIIVATAEVFDPANETSTAVAILNTPRIDHTATLLADGRVLIAGGTSASGALTSVEIFDPANPGAGFRVLSATMGAARTRHTATRLHNGTVLIAGGDAAGSAEIFNPTTETFSSALLAMAAPRIGHTATLFSDDSVLLAGGNTDSMEYFSSIDQTFTLDPAKLTATRTGHDAISLSDTRLLFFGGDTGHTIDEFNTSADMLSLKATMDGASSSATLLANGKILVLRPDAAGLYAPDATDQATAFTVFDETSVPGSTALLRSGQTATELSGDKKILVAGGVNAQHQPTLQIAAFNPARIWTDKDDYQPDDPVLLYGSGWKPTENVYLYAVDSETEQWTYGSTATANAQGSFAVEPLFIVEMRHAGTKFDVSAVGAQSNMQADVTFTDTTNVNAATITINDGSTCATPKSTFVSSESVCSKVTVTALGGNNNAGTFFINWRNPSNTLVQSTAKTVALATFQDTFSLPTNAPAGTWTVRVCNNDNCNANGAVTSATFTVSGCTAPTVTQNPSNQTVTFGAASVSFSAAATGSPAPSVQWQVNTGSGFSDISGGTNTTLTIANPTVSMTGTQYRAVFTNSCNPATATTTAATLTVNKATPTATLSVTNSPATYNGSPQSATVVVSTSSVPGTVTNVKYNGSGTVPTNAATYTVTADFVPTDTTNYNTLANQSAGNFIIQKVTPTATLSVTNSPVTYNGLAQSATVVVSTSSVPGTVANVKYNGSGTVPTNAATYAVTADFVPTDTTNYNTLTNQSAGNFVISKANATISVTPYNVTYDGASHTATVACLAMHAHDRGDTSCMRRTVNRHVVRCD